MVSIHASVAHCRQQIRNTSGIAENVSQRTHMRTHTHTHTHASVSNPTIKTPQLTLCYSDSFLLPPRCHNNMIEFYLSITELGYIFFSFFFFCNSWIWSLLMRDFTAVCPYRRQQGVVWGWARLWSLSLSLSLYFGFYSYRFFTDIYRAAEKSSYSHSVLIGEGGVWRSSHIVSKSSRSELQRSVDLFLCSGEFM